MSTFHLIGDAVCFVAAILAAVSVASVLLAIQQRRDRRHSLWTIYNAPFDNGADELSGLQIRDAMRERFGRRSIAAPYVALNQLEEQGLITSRPNPEHEGQTFVGRLYRITPAGRRVVQEGAP